MDYVATVGVCLLVLCVLWVVGLALSSRGRMRTVESVVDELVTGLRDGPIVLDNDGSDLTLFTVWYSESTDSYTVVKGTRRPVYGDGTPMDPGDVKIATIEAESWAEAKTLYERVISRHMPANPDA